MEFFAGLVQARLIAAVHHEHQSGRVIVVMLPVGPHLPLAPHVPHGQAGAAPVRLQRLHVEAHGRHGHHALVVNQFVEEGGLPWAVQAQHQDLGLLPKLGSTNTHNDVEFVYMSSSVCVLRYCICAGLQCLASYDHGLKSVCFMCTQAFWPLPSVCDGIPSVPCVAFRNTIYIQSDGAKKWGDMELSGYCSSLSGVTSHLPMIISHTTIHRHTQTNTQTNRHTDTQRRQEVHVCRAVSLPGWMSPSDDIMGRFWLIVNVVLLLDSQHVGFQSASGNQWVI